jgi:hypothetical protein
MVQIISGIITPPPSKPLTKPPNIKIQYRNAKIKRQRQKQRQKQIQIQKQIQKQIQGKI